MKKNIILSLFLFMFIIGINSVFAATPGSSSSSSGSISDTMMLSMSLVNQDPDPAIAGDIVELRIGIENLGGDPANNLIVEIEPTYPIELVPGEDSVKKIGTIGGFQDEENMQIVKYKVRVDKEATAGSYEFKIKYYEEGASASVQKSFTIDVEGKDSAEVIYIDQVELMPGQQTEMQFTINNVGSAPLRDLSFKWENEDDIVLPVGSDNTKYIEYIDVGESAVLKYNVIASANADPDLYKLDLTLTYDDPLTNEEKQINTKAGVYVGGGTDFEVAYSGESSGETSFSIANIGSVSATSVTVKIPDQKGWQTSGSNSVIIGNLNEGDYTIASFTLEQTSRMQMPSMRTNQEEEIGSESSETSNNGNTILVDIVYTDSRGNRETISKEVIMSSSGSFNISRSGMSSSMASRRAQFASQQDPLAPIKDNLVWIIAVVVVLTFFIVVRKKRNKGRLKNPDYGYVSAFKDIFRKQKK